MFFSIASANFLKSVMISPMVTPMSQQAVLHISQLIVW